MKITVAVSLYNHRATHLNTPVFQGIVIKDAFGILRIKTQENGDGAGVGCGCGPVTAMTAMLSMQ